MSERVIFETGADVARARREQQGKDPIPGHAYEQRDLANQRSMRGQARLGIDRFGDRYGSLFSGRIT